MCEGLRFQLEFLETLQCKTDQEEQENITMRQAARAGQSASPPASASASGSEGPLDHNNVDDTVEDEDDDDDVDMTDEDFFQWLDHCHGNPTNRSYKVGQKNYADGNEDGSNTANGHRAEAEIRGVIPYLGPSHTPQMGTDADDNGMPCMNLAWSVADALNNTYVCILHTNGIHHLAMVTCFCHSEHNVPLDLVAARLLLASFTHIRTLFMTPLMDYFCLCNLELKASAYQFYQLICRLTMPIGNGELVNLYHEFR
jgi:hypothetical protein